jgi:Zn-finger nucleic acid-binding protein
MTRCPACDTDTLRPEQIDGRPLDACQQCGGVWVGREVLLTLRGVDLEAHPLLSAAPDADGVRSHPERRCGSCGEAMQSFKYRGGKVTAERCNPCDRVFFDRGELGVALREWREGFDVSDDARAALDGYKAGQGLGRVLGAEGGAATAGLTALVIFLYLVFEYDFDYSWGVILPVAAVIAFGVFFWARRSAREEQREARVHFERTTRAPAARDASPASASPRKPVGAARFQDCMFCGARFPAEAKRCPACDTDVF